MISDKKLQEKIDFTPHPGQVNVLKCNEREIVIACGRRWGKSIIAAYLAVRTFLQGLSDIRNKKRSSIKIWVVAPSYELSRKVFNYVIQFLTKYDKRYASFVNDRPFPQIKLSEQIWIQCKSATEPDSLIGEELDLLIIDEAAKISPRIYEFQLVAALGPRKGKVIMISTPFGQNWFYREFQKAKETNSAFQYSSRDGVAIDETEWNRIRGMVPSDVFEQEFQAVFRPGMASVFRNIRECIKENAYAEPQQGHKYIMGLDIAKFQDFTVITIIDENTHNVVFFDRFNKIPYTLQRDRIKNPATRYNAKIIIDSGNAGAVISDDLKAERFNVVDFRFTGTVSPDQQKKGSKERLVEKLSSCLEEYNIGLPPEDVLIDELETFGYDMTDSGNLKYSAPPGFHDDCVMSLALAVWELKGKIRQEIYEAKKAIPNLKRKFQYL